MTEQLTTLPATPLPAPVVEIRAVGGAEAAFVLSSWSQAHMRSPGQPWEFALYERHVQPTVKALLGRDDVWVIGAFGEWEGKPDRILGWLAWTPGDLPAVHFAFVRGRLRRRGIFSALLREAMVGRRWLYTHRGQIPKRAGRRRTGKKPPPYDTIVTDALAKRGIAAVFVEASEWLERMR